MYDLSFFVPRIKSNGNFGFRFAIRGLAFSSQQTKYQAARLEKAIRSCIFKKDNILQLRVGQTKYGPRARIGSQVNYKKAENIFAYSPHSQFKLFHCSKVFHVRSVTHGDVIRADAKDIPRIFQVRKLDLLTMPLTWFNI